VVLGAGQGGHAEELQEIYGQLALDDGNVAGAMDSGVSPGEAENVTGDHFPRPGSLSTPAAFCGTRPILFLFLCLAPARLPGLMFSMPMKHAHHSGPRAAFRMKPGSRWHIVIHLDHKSDIQLVPLPQFDQAVEKYSPNRRCGKSCRR